MILILARVTFKLVFVRATCVALVFVKVVTHVISLLVR